MNLQTKLESLIKVTERLHIGGHSRARFRRCGRSERLTRNSYKHFSIDIQASILFAFDALEREALDHKGAVVDLMKQLEWRDK